MERSGQKKKGILFITIAAACFAAMSFFVRESGNVPTMEKCFFRNLPAVFITTALLARSKEKFRIKKGSLRYLLIRGAGGTVGMVCNFWAIDHLVLSDANMLNKMSPFFSIILSIPILREKPSRFDWAVFAVAFTGALFVVKPTAGIASLPALVGLFGGFAAGFAYTYVRKLGLMGERGEVIVFFFSLFSCACFLPYLILAGVSLTLRQFMFLTLAGIAGSCGQFSITAAYKAAPAKEISVFDYMQVVFAAIIGFVLLGESPDNLSVLGYVMIIGVAALRWNRARKEA